MFSSLKSWINLPAAVKPYIKRDGTGEKVFATTRDIFCYAEGKVQVVTNKEGKEVVSMKQLYVDGNTAIEELDNVVFENTESEIRAIGYFYRNGLVDMKVVYL